MAIPSGSVPKTHTADDNNVSDAGAADGVPSANEQNGDNLILIFGETIKGEKFRPSDWCERLHGTLRALDDEDEEAVKEYVHLINYEGKKCVMIKQQLEELHAAVYQFFMRFAEDNRLKQEVISQKHWDSLHI